ncbi:MAG: hypothetical protein KDA52_25295, partial [Planctomycetaceae bacterium]|nr:hypothetical protein [Planctomycetaceae bacterium]
MALCATRRFGLSITIVVGCSTLQAQDEGATSQNVNVNRIHQLGYLVVTPRGPKDGGDFGPHTPG